MLAEELRSAIARLHLLPDGPAFPVTVSVGVAALRRGAGAAGTLIAAADAALYEAKAGGRHRVVSHSGQVTVTGDDESAIAPARTLAT